MSAVVARKREAKIERILDVASELFAERGYQATRMEDIAAGLDLQKGSLYYYFPSKESLLTALVERRVGYARDELRAIVARDEPVIARVRAGVAAHLTVFQQHASLYTIFNSERLHDISPDAATTVDDLGREYEELWAGLLTEGVAGGELRAGLDVPVTVKAILGACNLTLTWFRPGGRLTIDEVAASFADLFLSGIAA